MSSGINNKISHIERVKQKRKQVLGRHNHNVLCSSLHNKNNNNNNNNNELVNLNDITDDNIGYFLSESSSAISSSKENTRTQVHLLPP